MQVYLTLLGYTPSNRPTAGEVLECASLFVDELCLKSSALRDFRPALVLGKLCETIFVKSEPGIVLE